METIFLIPGITGSRLSLNNQEVWPPTFNEMASDYNRMNQLLDPKAVVTGIWDETLIDILGLIFRYPVYKPLIDKLDQIAHALGAKLVIFPYDWRVDLWSSKAPFTSSSEALAKAIEAEVAGGASSVTLVCHSMGSLVARLVLESSKYQTTNWFAAIHRLICICGPSGSAEGARKGLGL